MTMTADLVLCAVLGAAGGRVAAPDDGDAPGRRQLHHAVHQRPGPVREVLKLEHAGGAVGRSGVNCFVMRTWV